MARKREVKRKQAPRMNMPTANTGALMGQGIQSASTAAMGSQLASAEMGIEMARSQGIGTASTAAMGQPFNATVNTGAMPGPQSAATGARRRAVGTAATGAMPGPQSAATGAMPGPQSAATGAANIGGSAPQTSFTFFEGANSYDPRVGYYRTPPGQSPMQVLAQLLGEG